MLCVVSGSGVVSSKALVGHTLREGMHGVLMMDCKNISCD